MSNRADRFRSADIPYQRLVEEAATGILHDGMVDLETAAKADALGFSIQTLTTDAEDILDDTRAY